MKSYGKLLLDRNIFDWYEEKFGVSSEPFTKREALLWLLSNASYKGGEEGIATIKNCNKKIPYTLEKGEFYFALSDLQKDWNWKDRKEVLRFLEKLVKTETLSSRIIYSFKNKKGEITNMLIYKFINWENYQKFNTDKNATNIATNIATKNHTDYQLVKDDCATNNATNDATSLNEYKTNNIANCKGEIFSDEKEMDSYDDLNDEILYEIENNSSNNSLLVYKNENDFKNTIDNLISFSLENIPLNYPDKDTFLFFCKNKLGFNKDDNYLIYNYDILSKNNWCTNNDSISNWKSYTEKIIVKNYNPSTFRNFTKNNSLPKVNKVNDSSVSYIEIQGKKLFLKKEKGIEYVSETGTLWSTKNEYCLNLG